jgi:hypothetical protein
VTARAQRGCLGHGTDAGTPTPSGQGLTGSAQDVGPPKAVLTSGADAALHGWDILVPRFAYPITEFAGTLEVIIR